MGHTLIWDEWVISDASGENGATQQMEVYGMLTAFPRGKDAICLKRDSPWTRKLVQLGKANDAGSRLAYRALRRITSDASLCRLITVLDDAHGNQRANLDCIKDEDFYLLQTFWEGGADYLCTTDAPLSECLSTTGVAKILSRRELLARHVPAWDGRH